jgi:hypothetical protein
VQKMVWVGNDCWKGHLRIWGLVGQTDVNQIEYKLVVGFKIAETCHDFQSLNETSHPNIFYLHITFAACRQDAS